ncbi:hypothetical protein KO525_09055 [Psychrosphaera sp. B3R10]|uniref:pullulanase-associated domain-containing protein n=1 Tax=unclassified Psychrosphaera TaxID=2641570 RepID=UPI001C089C7E|nr:MULTISPECIES: pullulanase-associated domain-containing protein [unclassified Psychrosphaera]MBU2881466.1 hypothetical protein [Psychrosphaera sp. I2R16]MBU2989522.1 hypothetical protein [Psychrosphaera sp. B3R10]
MTNWLKTTGVVFCSVLLFGCLDKDDEVQVTQGAIIDRQTEASLSIVAAQMVEIQEQTAWSIRADVTATNGIEELPSQVRWEVVDAPSGFTMPLVWTDVVDGSSIVDFTTPDISEDQQVTLRVYAEVVESDTIAAAQIFHDITLELYANGEIVISGAVVDDPIPNAIVTIRVGEETFEVVADENGLYRIPIEFVDEDAVFEVTAVGQPGSGFESVEFKSYLGDGKSLLEDAGSDGELTASENININVSNVTTAIYVLVQDIIEEQSGETAPVEGAVLNQGEYDALVEQVDNEEVIQVAAVIQLVVDYGADLPENTNTVLELVEDLIKDEQAKDLFVQESIEQVVAENNDIDTLTLEDLVEDIIEDENLVPSADEQEFIGNYVVANTVRSFSSLFKNSKLLFGGVSLNANNVGTVSQFLTAGDRSFSWAVSGTQVIATFDSSFTLSEPLYPAKDDNTLFINGFSINQLANNANGRSWLVRVRGEYRNNSSGETTSFQSESVSITSINQSDLIAYNTSSLLNKELFLTVVDNSSAPTDNALLNASSQMLMFGEDSQGSFTNSNGNLVNFNWTIDALGSLNVAIVGSAGTPSQNITYRRVRKVTDSIAYNVSTVVNIDNNTYAFSDLAYNLSNSALPSDFSFNKTYKTVGSDDTFTLLPDNTGFYYYPANATKFEHFSYSVSSNTVNISSYGTQGRKCVVGTPCALSKSVEIEFDSFVNSRLTFHSVESKSGMNEGSVAIAKSIRDAVLTKSSIPATLSLYFAESDSVYSYFLNQDGSGQVNAGSETGVCSAVSWDVSDEGRLVVTENSTDTTFRLLAGSVKQGVFWATTGATSKLFSTTSKVNACADVAETFIPLIDENITLGNYRLDDTETGNQVVIRFNEDKTGYLINGAEYYNAELADSMSNYLAPLTWAINSEGRLNLSVSGSSSIELLLKQNTFTSGTVQLSRDTTNNNEFDEVTSFAISYIKGCNQDFDGDGISNCFDKDDDNDGAEDSVDAFPLNSAETSDFDKDGIGDNADLDDDNDGVADEIDADPFDPLVGERKEFTTAMVDGKVFVSTGVWQNGILPQSAETFTFGSSKTLIADHGLQNGITQAEFDWRISDDAVVLENGTTVNSETIYYPFDQILERFAFTQEVVDELNSAYENGQLGQNWIIVSSGVVNKSIVLVDDSVPGELEVNVEDTYAFEIEPITDYVFINDPRKEEMLGSYSAKLFDVSANISLGSSVSDVVGRWILNYDYTLTSELAFSQNYALLSDLFTITNDNIAFTEIAQDNFNVSMNNGALVLTSGEVSYTYTAVQQEGNLYLATVDKQVNGVSEYVLAVLIASFDDSASTFIGGLGKEFPNVHIAHINSGYADQWDGDKLKIENVWGYRFGPNGVLNRGITGKKGTMYNEGVDFFTLGTEWTWDANDSQVFLEILYDENTAYENHYLRTWDVIATNSSGFTAVFERERRTQDWNYDGTITADEENRWYILPRINFIAPDDLSRYQPAWDNTVAIGSFSDDDTDGDNIPNNSDNDDDNDGYSDLVELQLGTDPLDPASNGDDFDGDGIIDANDDDDDNDGVLDADDIAPTDPRVGAKLTIDSSVIDNTYLEITNSPLAKPSFSIEESGALVSFDHSTGVFVYADDQTYEVGTFAIVDDVLIIDSESDVDTYIEDVFYLAEMGIIDYQTAESYYNIIGSSDVVVREQSIGNDLYLIKQDGLVDTFYTIEKEQILFVNDWQRELLTGSTSLTPLLVENAEIVELTRLSDSTSIPFVDSEIVDKTWAMPVLIDTRSDDSMIKDVAVEFSSTTFESKVLDIQGSWAIDIDGKLHLTTEDGDLIVLTRYDEFDGMSSVHSLVTTQLKEQIEGAWIDGTGGYDMPTPVATATQNQAVIYYNREDKNFTGWTLHVWSGGECTGSLVTDTEWNDGLEPDGIDPEFGAYWTVDTVDDNSCINFIPHNVNEGIQTQDFKAYLAESDTNQFFVLSLDDRDGWDTTDVLTNPRTYASLDIYNMVDAVLSDYRYIGAQDSAASFAGIADHLVNFSWDLLDPDNYDESGNPYPHNFDFLVTLNSGHFIWETGGFDYNSVVENQRWEIDPIDGSFVERYIVNRSDMAENSDCTVNDIDCVIHYEYRFTPLSTVGNRTYFVGSYFYNPTAWAGQYDPMDINADTFNVGFLETSEFSDFDFDLDGISDTWDNDDDNDGVNDNDDSFPFDPNESHDTDQDGIGNNADLDDDNDGVDDENDVDPLDPEYGVKVEINANSFTNEYILISSGRGSNPDFNLFTANGIRLSYAANGEYRASNFNGDISGTWSVVNNTAIADLNGDTEVVWFTAWDLLDVGVVDFDTALRFVDEFGENSFEVEVRSTKEELSLIEESQLERHFRIVTTASYLPVDENYREALYGSVGAAAKLAIRNQYNATYRVESEMQFDTLSTANFNGVYTFPGLPYDSDDDGEIDSTITDIVDMNNNVSITGLTPDFTWQVVNGELVLTYPGVGLVKVKKHKTFAQSYSALVSSEFNGEHYSDYDLVVEHELSVDSSFIVDQAVLSAWSMTNPDSFDEHGVKPDWVYGYRLENGGASRTIFGNDIDLSYPNGGWIANNWQLKDGTITIETGIDEQYNNVNCADSDLICNPQYKRHWVPVAQEGQRLYVLEWEMENSNYWDFNNKVENWYMRILPRLNFYEVYPLNIDTDGDGVNDAIDDDADSDGVLNINDAFQFDTNEQVDSDGDGVGDNGDVFPNNPAEQFDNDMDGIGDNEDLDDDNDGINDVDDPTPYEDTRTVSMLNFNDAELSACLNDNYADELIYSVTNVVCNGYQVTDLSGIHQLPNIADFAIYDNEFVTDFSPLTALSYLRRFAISSPIFNNSDLADLASIDSLESLWINAGNVTSIESLRNHPSMNAIHIWGLQDTTQIEMDVILTWSEVLELALDAHTVSDFAVLGQLTSLRTLYIHGEVSDAEAVEIGKLVNLENFSFGWGPQWSQQAINDSVGQFTKLRELFINDMIVEDMSFLLSFDDLERVELANSSPVIISQMSDLEARGVYVEQYINHHSMFSNLLIGKHTLTDVLNDQGQLIDVGVTFETDHSGVIDWGFGEELFYWSITDEGRVIVDYDASNEVERWYWRTFFEQEYGYSEGIVGIEVDFNNDGIYEKHLEQRFSASKSTLAYVGLTDVAGRHTFTNPSDNTEQEIVFNEDGTGVVTWDVNPETFTWSFDAEGRVVVVYDDINTIETDRWTWHYTDRNDQVYFSGSVTLEVSEYGDGNYNLTEFSYALLTKEVYSQSLIGAWYLGNELDNSDYNVLIFINDHQYILGHTKNMENSNLVSGEFGNYSWNESTGEFQAYLIGESDGDAGLTTEPSLLSYNGDMLTLYENGGETFELHRIVGENEIAGSWITPSSGGFAGHSVLTIIDANRYFYIHTTEDSNTQQVTGEYGTYTWDKDTFIMTSVVVDESDSNHGLNGLDKEVTVANGILSIIDVNTSQLDAEATMIDANAYRPDYVAIEDIDGAFNLYVIDEHARYQQNFQTNGTGYAIWDEMDGIETFNWQFDPNLMEINVDYGSGGLPDIYRFKNHKRDENGALAGLEVVLTIDDDLDGNYDSETVDAVLIPLDQVIAMGLDDVVGSHLLYEYVDEILVERSIILNQDGTGVMEWDGIHNFTWHLDTEGAVVIDYNSETFTDRLVWQVAFDDSIGDYLNGVVELQVDNDGDGIFEEVDLTWYPVEKYD